VVVGSETTDSGNFTFTVALPENVKGVELVTIRLDSNQGAFAFNAFKTSAAARRTIDTPSTPASARSSPVACW
jgi:hypothetical protein